MFCVTQLTRAVIFVTDLPSKCEAGWSVLRTVVSDWQEQVSQQAQARSQPCDNGWCFSQILYLFRGLKIGVPSDCLGETSIFKLMIDDVTLKSKLESTWQVYSILVI